MYYTKIAIVFQKIVGLFFESGYFYQILNTQKSFTFMKRLPDYEITSFHLNKYNFLYDNLS